MTQADSSQEAPRKAFRVIYTVTNEVEGIIHADSLADARQRFRMGDYDEGAFEFNGTDGRTGGVRITRWPMEDLDA